ncbi:C-terminal topoisomerase domain [Carpediemonas membranifera]|uniref:C-terminal topoisomerase domain n=1 Tax=Carpediemonas membranifera TaxID=201153 RepID=A0A8J6E926_9EUKA|nr:C-terminal topoisomerase domain [Carpediemonas membranifera]|eukprot:KAG9392725.1 C-terminal topoisomerase domain [Carpediemonas membranifera]
MKKADEKKADLDASRTLVEALLRFTVKRFSETSLSDAAKEASAELGIAIKEIEKSALDVAHRDLAKTVFVKREKGSDESTPYTPTGKQAVSKLKTELGRYRRLSTAIEKLEGSVTERESLKTVALGTSRLNYLDPRITVAWCRREGFPITKVFNKTLLTKFPWVLDVPAEWRFRPEE